MKVLICFWCYDRIVDNRTSFDCEQQSTLFDRCVNQYAKCLSNCDLSFVNQCEQGRVAIPVKVVIAVLFKLVIGQIDPMWRPSTR